MGHFSGYKMTTNSVSHLLAILLLRSIVVTEVAHALRSPYTSRRTFNCVSLTIIKVTCLTHANHKPECCYKIDYINEWVKHYTVTLNGHCITWMISCYLVDLTFGNASLHWKLASRLALNWGGRHIRWEAPVLA